MSGQDEYDDLDDLDDYLDEFQDEILSKTQEELESDAKERESVKNKSANEDTKAPEKKPSDVPFTEENLEKQLESVFEELQQDSPEAKQQFESLLKQLSHLEDTEEQKVTNNTDENLKDTISSTINRLKQSGAKVDQSIKDESPEKLLSDLLNSLNIDGEGNGDDDDDLNITNLLTELLDQIASKAVLYEPLKSLNVKYPLWIKENHDKVTTEELTRYTKQSEIIQSIVDKFEEPNYSDTSKLHKDFIATKLEEMQSSGDPPNDLLEDLSKTGLPGFQFDSDDLPKDFENTLGKDLGDLEDTCKQT